MSEYSAAVPAKGGQQMISKKKREGGREALVSDAHQSQWYVQPTACGQRKGYRMYIHVCVRVYVVKTRDVCPSLPLARWRLTWVKGLGNIHVHEGTAFAAAGGLTAMLSL